MVFQHFSLFDALTVTQNIALALAGERDMAALARRIEKVSGDYGLPLRPNAVVADLSVGERQRIEVVRCLLQEPRLLILDEPTAVLTPQEADQLFVTLERLAGEGCALLYISHRLEEVKRLCHDATILRHGRLVARVDPQQESAASLAKLMIGSDVAALKPASGAAPGAPLLELVGLSMPTDDPFGVALKSIDLVVRSGEIVAVAGGRGQRPVGALRFHLRASGRASPWMRSSWRACPAAARTSRRGAGAVPPSCRKSASATLPSRTCRSPRTSFSPIMPWGKMSSRNGLINRRAAQDVMTRVAEHYDVRKNAPDPEARALSGGNLQKFVVGRELERRPRILAVHQPTWGVDAGAAAFIRQSLIDIARSGSAVLMISQDLDEIFEIADRIAVISRGELSEAYPAGELSPERIGLLMAGTHERAGRGAKLEAGA